MCDAWPEPKVRELRGASRAIPGFVARIVQEAGDVPEGKVARVRITGAKAVRFGKGSSVDIGFEVAPQAAWSAVAAIGRAQGFEGALVLLRTWFKLRAKRQNAEHAEARDAIP